MFYEVHIRYRAWGADIPTDSPSRSTQGPERRPLHIAYWSRDVPGTYVALRQDTDTGPGRGRQEFTGALLYGRYGLPDMDVYISRSKGRNIALGTRVLESTILGYKSVQSGSGGPWSVGRPQ